MTRTITTTAELDALPPASVILHVDDRGHHVFQRSVHTGTWYLPGAMGRVEPRLPATVLHEPGKEEPRPLPDREQIAEVIARSLRQHIDPDSSVRVYELHHLAADAVLALLKGPL